MLEMKKYCIELIYLLKLGLPLTFSYFCMFIPFEVSVAFCGHLGKEELDAVGLGASYSYMFGLCFCYAAGYAVNGLFAHSYGARQYHMLTQQLHQAIIVSTLIFMVYVLNFSLLSEYFLLFVAPDAIVARYAAKYLMILIPGILMRLYYHILSKFLEAQNIVLPGAIATTVGAIEAIIFHLFFVTFLNLGIVGAGIALSLTFCTMPIILIVSAFRYKKIRKLNIFSVDSGALESWFEISKLVTLSLANSFVVWLSGEIGAFLSGKLGKTELGAQTVLTHFSGFFYCVPAGLGTACTTRIGQFIGEKEEKKAAIAYKLSIFLHGLFGIISAAIYIIFRYQLTSIFSNQPDVIDLAVYLAPYLALSDFLTFIYMGDAAVLRAVECFTFPAVVSSLIFYGLNLPLSFYMMYFTEYRLEGYWIPTSIGNLIQMIILTTYVGCFDFKKIISVYNRKYENIHSFEKVGGSQLKDSKSSLPESESENSPLLNDSNNSKKPPKTPNRKEENVKGDVLEIDGNLGSKEQANQVTMRFIILYRIPAVVTVILTTVISFALRYFQSTIFGDNANNGISNNSSYMLINITSLRNFE